MQDSLTEIDDFEFLSLKDRSRFEGNDGVPTREQRNDALVQKMGTLASDDVFMNAFTDVYVEVSFRGQKVGVETASPSISETIVSQFSIPQGYILVTQEAERLHRSCGKLGSRIMTHGNLRFYYLTLKKELVLEAVVPVRRVEWVFSSKMKGHDTERMRLVTKTCGSGAQAWCFLLTTGAQYRLSMTPGRPRRFPMHSFGVVVRPAANAPFFPLTPFRILRYRQFRRPRL